MAGDPRPGDRVVLDPAFGDVVEEQREIQDFAVTRLDLADQVVGERVGRIGAVLDFGQHADAAQQMLVHGVVMIHVELHHRHDVAELRNEAAEHAGLVHAPQHDLGVGLGGEDFPEQQVGLRDSRAAACRSA